MKVQPIYAPAMDDDADYREVYAMRRGKIAYVHGSKFSNIPAHAEVARDGTITLRGPVSRDALEVAENMSFTPPPTLAQLVQRAAVSFATWVQEYKFKILWDAFAFVGIAATCKAILFLATGGVQ